MTTDTPRTDAVAIPVGHGVRDNRPDLNGNTHTHYSVVPTLFARIIERELAALRADAALLDWMGSIGTDTDITICPPGNHGGPADKWLVSIDNDTPRCRPLIEAYGDTPRAALAAARAK